MTKRRVRRHLRSEKDASKLLPSWKNILHLKFWTILHSRKRQAKEMELAGHARKDKRNYHKNSRRSRDNVLNFVVKVNKVNTELFKLITGSGSDQWDNNDVCVKHSNILCMSKPRLGRFIGLLEYGFPRRLDSVPGSSLVTRFSFASEGQINPLPSVELDST